MNINNPRILKQETAILSQEVAQAVLGIKEQVCMLPEEMTKKIVVTFYPSEQHKVSDNILNFADKLRRALIQLGIRIIPYEESLVQPTLKRRVKLFLFSLLGKLPKGFKRGKKIREGVTVISLGEGVAGNLAMDNTMSFAKNTVITILDMPDDINSETDFHRHFDLAMNLFTYHMTNIAIVVNEKQWIPYNFNASHPLYTFSSDFQQDILKGLIPKVYAPIRPPKIKEFTILSKGFDPSDNVHKPLVEDFLASGLLLENTALYPPGKKLDSLPFRNDFYRWIGSLHLDHRNGMSFGFLARQLPTKLGRVFRYDDFYKSIDNRSSLTHDYFSIDGKTYFKLIVRGERLVVEVPEAWVLTQRSGSNKTNINPSTDLLKMGLKNGEMFLQTPKGLSMSPDYKPSFDTRVILAHAVGNAILAAIMKFFDRDSNFSNRLENNGLALAHWHGYINPAAVPSGWVVYGEHNVPVSCSTHQSAVFALEGKIKNFIKFYEVNSEYCGDIHIEPHHGSNITHFSLCDLGHFLTDGKDVTNLGNYYLNAYLKK